ncbi:MAG: amino acid permease [Thermoplasmatota archaeon]
MVQLERSLSLWQITLMSVGIILGAGIYVLIGEAAGLSGNTLWASFILAALVATFTGLSYAELSSRFPSAAAEYTYVEGTFGYRLAWVTGWLIIAGSVIGSATVALGFSRYFAALFSTPVIPVAFITLAVIGVVLFAGVQETASLTILFTVIEAAGLLIIMVIGLPSVGSVDYLEMANGLKGVIEAGVLIFFGYIGFEGITRLASETKNPEKTIPKAILVSIAVTTVFYILVGIAAVSVVPWQELATAEAPLALVAEKVFGSNSFLILSVIALFSTFNTALVMLLSGSRLVYGIAKEKGLPKIFTKVSSKTKTPWIAIITVVLASMLFLSLGNVKTIANLTNFTIFAVFIMVNAVVIYVRYKKPVATGFKSPVSIGKLPVFPVLGLVSALFMMVNVEWSVLLMGIGLIVLGFLFQYFFKKEP